MWASLRQRWIDAPAAVGAAAAAALPAAAAPADDLALRFSAALFGVSAPRPEQPPAAEEALLRRLLDATRALGDDPLLPRLPTVLPRLMGLLRHGDRDLRELTDLLAHEPALLGEVMRLARATGRHGARPVADLQAAVALLGQRGLQQVVSRAALAPVFVLQRGRFGAAAGPRLWEHAQRCAHACALSHGEGIDGFEAYLAGMAARTGLIVALRLIDREGVRSAPASLQFHQDLGALAHRLSARIAHHWHLSGDTVQAIAGLAPPGDGGGPLAHALRRADRCGMAHVLALPREAMPEADRHCLAELDRAFGARP